MCMVIGIVASWSHLFPISWLVVPATCECSDAIVYKKCVALAKKSFYKFPKKGRCRLVFNTFLSARKSTRRGEKKTENGNEERACAFTTRIQKQKCCAKKYATFIAFWPHAARVLLAATLDNILTHTFVILLLATIILPFYREMKRRCLWKCVRIVSKDLHIYTHI